MERKELASANRKLVGRLGLVVLAMFGFGFALVPLYDVFCEITGLNGKTGRIDVEAALTQEVDTGREVTVEFLVSVNSARASAPAAVRAAVSRALARSSTSRASWLPYLSAPARSAWPGLGRVTARAASGPG